MHHKNIASKYKGMLTVILWTTVVFSIVVFAFPVGWSVEFYPLDGRFQTYNSVLRVIAGEIPGADFQPYLGIGVTWVISLITLLFGGSFIASFIGENLLHALMLLLSIGVTINLVSNRNINRTNLVPFLWLLFVGAFYWAQRIFDVNLFFDVLIQPANSSYGIRASILFLAALILLLALRSSFGQRYYEVTVGIVSGLAIFWSNDFGMAWALTCLIFVPMVGSVRLFSYHVFLSWIKCWATFALTVFIFGELITWGHLSDWIAYNYSVAQEQSWYFSSPSSYSLTSRLWHLEWLDIAALVVPLIAISYLFRARGSQDVKTRILCLVFFAASLGGFIPFLHGSAARRYFVQTEFLFLLAVAITILIWLSSRLLKSPARRTAYPILHFSVITLSLFMIAHKAMDLFLESDSTQQDYVADLGGYLPRSFQSEIAIGRFISADTANLPPSQRVVSTFSTLIDYLAGARNPTGFDYLIHVRGPEARQHYLRYLEVEKPRYATTIRMDFSIFSWASWRSDWWFYQQILMHYDPYRFTPYHVIWKRRASVRERLLDGLDCTISKSSSKEYSLIIDRDTSVEGTKPILASVTVKYSKNVAASLEKLVGLNSPIVVSESSNIPAYLGYGTYSSLPVMLDPTKDTVSLPVQLWSKKGAVLNLAFPAGIDGTLAIEECSAQELYPIDDISDRRAFAISVDNKAGWANGVYAGPVTADGSRAGIMLGSDADLSNVMINTMLLLHDGDMRRVMRRDGNIVWLTGDRLNPADGFPNSVTFYLQ